MKTSLRYIIFISALFMCIDLNCQNAGDRLKVESIYDALQDRGTSSKDVAGLMPFINWKDAEHLEQANKKHSITLGAIMNQHWSSVQFEDLEYDHPEENKLIVTGIVSGRRHSECEFISTPFRHRWSFENGKIVAFNE